MRSTRTLFGVDKFPDQPRIHKKHAIGLVTNDAATTSYGELSRVALLKSGFNIVRLFSPEHGLHTKGADGMAQKNIKDSITALPVISLYGENLLPQEEDLRDIDCFVFDIPDAGTRFYTYLWTLTYIMEACAAFRKRLIILDRPNPLSGNLSLVEGPMLDETNCSSFIGRWNIPIRHSCTYGELANYFSAVKNIRADIAVIKAENWDRMKPVVQGDWLFMPTSPAIKDVEMGLLYPGTGLLEGINVNEGRGTDTPFSIFGAPWIDPVTLLAQFTKLNLPGITANEVAYTPEDSVYKNEKCFGLKLHVSSAEELKPVFTGLELIRLIQNLFPESCSERLYKTAANPSGQYHLDKLTGVRNSFQRMKTGEMVNEFYTTDNWVEKIRPFLLY